MSPPLQSLLAAGVLVVVAVAAAAAVLWTLAQS